MYEVKVRKNYILCFLGRAFDARSGQRVTAL